MARTRESSAGLARRADAHENAAIGGGGRLCRLGSGIGTACGSSTPDPAPNEASAAASGGPPTSSAPAWAKGSEPVGANDFSGVYQIAYDDGTVETWTAIPCGPGCAEVDQGQFGLVKSTINGQAQLEGTTWKLVVRRPDAVTCEDGSQYEGTSTWTWDATTLKGSLAGNQMVDACDKPAGTELEELPFALTKQSSGAPAPGFRTS